MMSSTTRQRSAAILCLAGEGGHMAEMVALMDVLAPNLRACQKLLVTDTSRYAFDRFDKVFIFGSLRDKGSIVKTFIKLPCTLLVSLVRTLILHYRYRPVIVLSTGPGVAVIPAMVLKLLGVEIIHFECSARFYSISASTTFIALTCDRFFVQNKQLEELHKKALYCGLLLS